MKAWILFFIGTLAYFLNRYINRKEKKPGFDFKYWFKDNWPELLFTFLFDLAAIIILLDPDTVIDVTKLEWFPVWLVLPVKLAGSFLLGFGGGWAVYTVFKKKAKYASEKKPD
ncbi:MAG: hypothetical protein MUC78_13840 [Bacteroidales bacterium]|jgi:hypothetical protein|nr:hypothetical protein [Bacteroidales bacterium]